ncbi:MAG: hypothetical protein JO257_02255 [Deltaproteobacteria bacterium]|nr:hypothetical protein [Deltaproteobacteria bacterium]
MTRAKAKPGTERYRDERRSGGGPRMHGQGWHDHPAHDMDRVVGGGRASSKRRASATEAADERVGMGKHVGRKDKGASRINEPSPRGKGIKRRNPTAARNRTAARNKATSTRARR